jgi:hypothetical protein
MKILLTKEQLETVAIPYFSNTKVNDLKLFRESWNQLKPKEKELVIELYKMLYPKKSEKLNEGLMDWVQGGLDVVGIFDPTGIADLTNAVLYFGRGEILFGMLSLISIIPVAGDMIAKPIILGGKALGLPFKAFKAAVASGDAVKIAKSAKTMEKLGPVGKKVTEFIESFNKGMGDKISKLLQKGKNIPVVGKFTKTIEGWINIFKKAGKEINLPTTASKFEIKTGSGVWKGTLKGSEKVDFLKTLKEMIPSTKGMSTTAFRDMAKKGKFSLFGKEFTKIWQVPAHRKMLGRTKLYLRFLDKLGLANFIGPDELAQEVPNVESKLQSFMNSPEGQSAFNEEFVNSPDMQSYYQGTPNVTTPNKTTTSTPSNTDVGSIAQKLGLSSITPEIGNVLSQFLKTAI